MGASIPVDLPRLWHDHPDAGCSAPMPAVRIERDNGVRDL